MLSKIEFLSCNDGEKQKGRTKECQLQWFHWINLVRREVKKNFTERHLWLLHMFVEILKRRSKIDNSHVNVLLNEPKMRSSTHQKRNESAFHLQYANINAKDIQTVSTVDPELSKVKWRVQIVLRDCIQCTSLWPKRISNLK